MDWRVALYALLGIGLLVAGPWVLSVVPLDEPGSQYTYSVQPVEENRSNYTETDVYAFATLSPEARAGIERALAADDGTYVVTNESMRAPEFTFTTERGELGSGRYIVAYQGTHYELTTRNTTPLFTSESLAIWAVQLCRLLLGYFFLAIAGCRGLRSIIHKRQRSS
ncbi:hypothetical protein [Halopiger djelfimassiliensis]|uniref:hypothetical protein n=1 Tax=Halopiger djelfimassiliensis TaxID=1293047 RepID=UPI0006783124|nr:hypothetical protein [Halopiger djelfimassiliensis]